jgi:hypothetical protein
VTSGLKAEDIKDQVREAVDDGEGLSKPGTRLTMPNTRHQPATRLISPSSRCRLTRLAAVPLSYAGMPIWGRGTALKRFEALYQGTWSLDPKTDELKVFEVQPGVAQLYVPITFLIAPAGQPAQPTRFLMNQILVKTPDGWKVSSVLPIPVPTQ